MTALTQSRLKELFSYDPETGLFTRLKKVSGSRVGDVAGCKKPSGHIVIRIDAVLYRAHRLAWFYVHGNWPVNVIDHINGIPDDNRMKNLRDVPQGLNTQNQKKPRKNNSSGYLGVHFFKSRGVFKAELSVGTKNKFIGYYETAEEAHAAYIDAKRKYHEGNTL